MVMVADNEVQADGLRVKRFVRGTDATIHGDDKFYSVRFERVQRLYIEAISFIEAIRDVAAHISSQCLKGMDEQRCSSDSIHIVIAIDRNQLAMIERVANPIHCCTHANQLEWIGIGIWLSLEEGARFCIRTQAAVEDDLLQNGRKLGKRFVGL